MTSEAPIERDAARVLLFDAADRLLLLRGVEPTDPCAGWWWFTPGGGLDQAETHRQGAVRELAEETGLHLDPAALVGPVWRRESTFDFAGMTITQRELYFVARVSSWAVAATGYSDLERRALTGHRWWTLKELETTDQTVYPPELATLLPEVLAGTWSGPPRNVA